MMIFGYKPHSCGFRVKESRPIFPSRSAMDESGTLAGMKITFYFLNCFIGFSHGPARCLWSMMTEECIGSI